jgi:hypothetical protein
MFAVRCDGHGAVTLLGPESIEALDAGAVRWRCWCGHRGRSCVTDLVAPAGRPRAMPSAA